MAGQTTAALFEPRGRVHRTVAGIRRSTYTG